MTPMPNAPRTPLKSFRIPEDHNDVITHPDNWDYDDEA